MASRRGIASFAALRAVLAVAGLLGALFLLIATFATVVAVRVGTTSQLADFDTTSSGWDRHGPALVLLAVLGVVALGGALRGARPAMVALSVAGAAALAIALAWDAPDLGDAGEVRDLYEDATASTGAGYHLETAGGVLLVLSGGGLLVLAPRGRSGRTRRQRAATQRDPRRSGAREELAPLVDDR